MNLYVAHRKQSQVCRGLRQTKLVFSSCLNCPKSMSSCRRRRTLGRLFQTHGPATEKLMSPNRVLVLGTVQTLVSAERKWQRSGSLVMNWHSSARYGGAWPRSELNTRTTNLHSTRRHTGKPVKLLQNRRNTIYIDWN